MTYINPDKVAPIDGELNPEEFLDFIIKNNDGEKPQFGIGSELRKKLGGPVSAFNKDHKELLDSISKLMFQYGYGKSENKTNEFYDVYQPWKDAHKIGGHFQYQKTIKEQKDVKENKENLELQNLRFANTLLISQVADYPTLKRQKSTATIVAIVSVIIAGMSLLFAVMQYLKCR